MLAALSSETFESQLATDYSTLDRHGHIDSLRRQMGISVDAADAVDVRKPSSSLHEPT